MQGIENRTRKEFLETQVDEENVQAGYLLPNYRHKNTLDRHFDGVRQLHPSESDL